MQQYSLEPANFPDYRDFFKHRFESLRSQNKHFSLQSCAKRAKISKSLLQFLLQKKRHISLDKIPDIARCLKLNLDEEYFVYLQLCKNSSRNPVVQAHFEKIMDRIRHEYVVLDEELTAFSSDNEKPLYLNSLLMILRSLVRLPDFQEDAKWIAANAHIPWADEGQIQSALDELEKKGFATRDSAGRLQPKEETLWRPDPYDPTGQSVSTVSAETVARFMKFPQLYRPSVYSTSSLSFDEENLLAVEKLMIEMHHKLMALSAASKRPTAVAYIGNFFLTVVRLGKKKA